MKIIVIVLFVFSIIELEESSDSPTKPCPLSLSIPLSSDDVQHYSNGSLLHQGLLYSPEHFYMDGNELYGCACEIKSPCIRKCCEENQALTNSERPECMGMNKTLPDLLLGDDQLSDELRNMSSVSTHFKVIQNRICPNGTYRLQPERFEEDNFLLFSNGSLSTLETLLPQWRYCIDWQENLTTITVLVCHVPEPEIVTAETTIYPFGIIISIPFLLATLITYSIIPELMNLYGMTLMCYVGCLIAAYGSLAGGQLVYHGQPLCIIIETSSLLYNNVRQRCMDAFIHRIWNFETALQGKLESVGHAKHKHEITSRSRPIEKRR